MSNKEAIVRLKQAGVRNSQIAELLGVSRQYVSRISILSGLSEQPNKNLRKNGVATIGFASALLGVSETAVRRYSDNGTIPSFYNNGNGGGTRLFMLEDLWSFLQSEKVNELVIKNNRVYR
jgi:DNA-binding transcriptional MerR regulator